MISENAVKSFLTKRREDFHWMKDLTEAELDQFLAETEPQPDLNGSRKHQKVGFALGITNPNFYFMFSMGLGKTKLILELLRYLYQTGQITRWAVVLAPSDVIVEGWRDEIKKWTPDLPYVALLGSGEEKWEEVSQFESGLVIATYVGLATMLSRLEHPVDRKTRKPSKHKKWIPVVGWVNTFCEHVDAFVLDEITRCANHESLSYRVANQVSQAAKFRYGLAGRPFGRDPLNLWAQLFLLDRGETLSPNLSFYRDVFFHKRKSRWGGPYHYEYIFNRKRDGDLARILAHKSLRYAAEECLDLPPLIRQTNRMTFGDDMAAFYNRLIDEIIKHKGDPDQIKMSFIRMRQICSGFLSIKGEEERIEVEFDTNPKIEALMELIEQMPAGAKCLIFHEFIWTGARICAELSKYTNKIEHGWLNGKTKMSEWQDMKDRFNTDPNFKALVVSWKKGNMGLNLQAANYVFIMESPVSPIERDQLEHRARRDGQTKTVFMHDIIIRNSVEERILEYLQEGNDLFKKLVERPEDLLVRV